MINCAKRWIYRFKCYIDSKLTLPKQVSHCKLSSHKMVPGQLKSASTFYKNIFYLSIGFITISCLRFAIMNNKLPSFNRLDNPARILASPYRQLNYAYIWTYNCWLLLNPFNLSCDWSSSSIELITSLLDPKNVITLATFIFTLLFLLQSDTISWMGLGFMMITFLPASNIFFPLGFVIAERVLYLPSMGFSIIIARGFVLLYSSIKSKRYWIKILFHLVTFICASSLLVKTVHRCTEWQNELSLFTSGLNVNPTNVKLLNNVGRLYENQGNLSMALSFYEKAVSIQPDDVRGYLNLGKALTKIGRLEEAERSYRKALDLIPRPNEISSKLNSNHYLPVSHHHTYNENDEKLKQDKEKQQQELHPSSIKSSSFESKGDDESTRQSIVATTGRLTLPGYERLVNQGTNTDSMMNHNEAKHEVKVSPSLASPSALPLASQSASDNSGLTAITLNHLQGLLHYASLISKDERRLDEANRMFSTIASMRPDYSVTYSTWIQSMIHGNEQNNHANYNDQTHKGSPQNDQTANGQILLSQVTSNNKQTDPDILYNMAILFNNNGNIENALNLFDQALSIDPYHEETLLTSARIIKDNELIGDYITIAMERLETLVSMGKADETVYFDLGMLAIRSGHMLTARRYFAKAIELKPNFTEALFNMALLLYKDEKPKDALPFLKFLLQTEETHGKALLLMVAINSSNNDADESNDLPKSQQLSSPVSSSLSPS